MKQIKIRYILSLIKFFFSSIKAKYLLPFAYNTENQKQLYDINTFPHQYRRNRHHHYTGDRTKYH